MASKAAPPDVNRQMMEALWLSITQMKALKSGCKVELRTWLPAAKHCVCSYGKEACAEITARNATVDNAVNQSEESHCRKSSIVWADSCFKAGWACLSESSLSATDAEDDFVGSG